jgi:hypothetical protein
MAFRRLWRQRARTSRVGFRPRVESLEERLAPALDPYSQYAVNAAAVGTRSIVGADKGNPIVPLYTDYNRGDTYGVVDGFSPAAPHLVTDPDDADSGAGVSSFHATWDGTGTIARFQFDIGLQQLNRPRAIPDFGTASAVRFLAKGDVPGRVIEVKVYQTSSTSPFFNPTPIADVKFSLTTSWQDYGLTLPAGLSPSDLSSVQFVLTRQSDPGGAQFGLDEVRIDTGGFDPLRAPLSYRALYAPASSDPTTPQGRDVNIYPNHSYLYDTALDIKALLASGAGGTLQTAVGVARGILATALSNGSYYDQRNDGQTLQGNGKPRPAFNTTPTQPPVADQTLGDNAWFGMALLDLYNATGNRQYLTAARKVSDWAEANLKAGNSALKGYFGGFDNNGQIVASRSTDQNTAAAQLNFLLAAALTARNDPSASTYAARADFAATFVFAMFDNVGGKFWAGTSTGDTINTASVPLDAQLWGYLSIGQWAKYVNDAAVQALFTSAFQWAQNHLIVSDGPFTGFTFSTGSNPVVWFAGNAYAAEEYYLRGNQAQAEASFRLLEQARLNGANHDPNGIGLIAASSNNLQDPMLGVVYDARLALEPSAWAGLFSGGYNPFTFTRRALPFSDPFATPDGTPLSPLWVVPSGSFSVQGAKAVAGANTSLAVANTAPASDVVVQAGIALPATGTPYAGVVARYGGPGVANFDLGEIVGNHGSFTAYIFRNYGGTFALLASKPVASGTGTLTLETLGKSLQLLLSGQQIVFAHDSSLGAGTTGLWGSAGATFANFQASPPFAVSLPFGDPFTQADGTPLSSAWFPRAGNFTVQSGRAVSNVAGSLATVNHVPTSDVIAQTDIALGATGTVYAGLVARYAGPGLSNFDLGEIVGSNGGFTAYIFRNNGGVFTLLARNTVFYTNTVFYGTGTGTLAFEALGSSLQLLLSGQLIASAYDTSLRAGTTGLWGSAGATFDNFQVSAAAVASLPFSDSFTQAIDTPLSPFWFPRAGTFLVKDNQGAFTPPFLRYTQALALTGTTLATVNFAPVADEVAQADIAGLRTFDGIPLDYLDAGLVVRYAGPGVSNFDLGEIVDDNGTFTAYILRNKGGTFTRLASEPVSGGTGTLSFEALGSSLQLLLNGQLIASAYDTSLGAGTTGLWGGAAAFGNFQTSAPAVPLPFSDTFTQADGTPLSTSWFPRAGNFTVQSSAAVANVSPSLATVNHAATANVAVQADIALSSSAGVQYAGLVARYGGPGASNYYLGEIVGSNGTFTAYIFRNQNGVFPQLGSASDGVYTQLGSASVGSGTGTLLFQVVGTSLKLSLNSTVLVSVTDSALTTGTTGIFGGGGASLDNFSATSP